MLYGIPSSSGFSSDAQRMESAFVHTMEYLRPQQNLVLKAAQAVATAAGFSCKPIITTAPPTVNKYTVEQVTAGIVSVDEYRKNSMGLEPLPAVVAGGNPAQEALRGSVGGLTGAIQLLTAVGTGELSSEAANFVAKELLGFEIPQDVLATLGKTTPTTPPVTAPAL
jgi:hypothetical protein